MSKKTFDSIMTGLQEAIRYVNGDETAAYRVLTVNPADIKQARKKIGLTRDAFATTFGISAATIRKWENGERVPNAAARVLLTIISREPEAVMRALR